MKILLIEDERSLLESMQKYLEQQGYVCETASNFREGEEKVSEHDYD